jgi:hypothetical protein
MEADAIQGLTHPKRVIKASTHLWKRRGAFTAAMSTNWAERLFVLTDTALFWFEVGGLTSQHGRIELRHIQRLRPIEAGSSSVSVEELGKHGPKYQLEVSHIMSDHVCLVGGTDHGLVQAWHDALTAAIDRAGTPGGHADLPTIPPAVPTSLLRLELTGIAAIGTLGKARQAMTGAMKSGLESTGVIRSRQAKGDHRVKDGWSTRVVVLTESALHFYKPFKQKAEQVRGPCAKTADRQTNLPPSPPPPLPNNL